MTEKMNVLSLSGSNLLVTEFLGYAINAIIYQRKLYPSETFIPFEGYGLTIMVTKEEKHRKYLGKILTQISDWLSAGQVRRLVLVICSARTNDVLERWHFDIQSTGAGFGDGEKVVPEVQREIKAILEQITASASRLPVLQEHCTFELLVHATKDCPVPDSWEESVSRSVANPSDISLNSFTTKIHRVGAAVTYRSAKA
eukprot:RCo003933